MILRNLKIGSIWFNRTIGNIKMATKIRHPPNELHLELQAARETSADFLFFIRKNCGVYPGGLGVVEKDRLNVVGNVALQCRARE